MRMLMRLLCPAQVAFALRGLFSLDGTAQKHQMKVNGMHNF